MTTRHRRCGRLASATAVLLGSAAAQTTWIVDNGYQGNLTFADAVQRASDGDTILIQYASGTNVDWSVTLAKSLTIVGDPGNEGVTGHLVIAGLTAQQRVVIRSLRQVTLPSPLPARISVQNCAGAVVLDEVTLVSTFAAGEALAVQDSQLVTLHRSALAGAPGLRSTGSAIVCSQSAVAGFGGVRFQGSSQDGWSATGCRLWITSSTCRGGTSLDFWGGPHRPGLVLRGTTVLAADSMFVGGGIVGPETASLDLDAGSWVFHDARCSLGSGLFPGWIAGATGNLTPVESGSITGGLTTVGQPAAFTLDAAAPAIGVLAVSLPGPEIPTAIGSLWLWAPATTLLGLGNVPFTGMVTLPPGAPRGTTIAVQGAVLHAGTLLLSVPVFSAAL